MLAQLDQANPGALDRWDRERWTPGEAGRFVVGTGQTIFVRLRENRGRLVGGPGRPAVDD